MVSMPMPAAAASSPIVIVTKLCQLLAQRSYAPGADEALPHLAADEEHEGREAHHLEVSLQLRDRLDVDTDHGQIGLLGLESVENGIHRPAGRAPFGREVEEHDPGLGGDGFV